MKLSFSIDIFKHILLGVFLLAYAYSLNDFYDKLEKKKFFILSLILTFLLLPFFNYFQIIISVIFLIIVTFYSAYPFRWKAKPFISSFCNGIGFTLIFLLGYFVTQSFNLNGILFTLLFFCFNMVAQFIHEIVHLKEDKKSNIVTTIVFYGERIGKIFCFLFLLVSLSINLFLFYIKSINIIFFIATLFFTIFFIIEIYREKIDKKFRKRYRILGLIIGFIYYISLTLKIL